VLKLGRYFIAKLQKDRKQLHEACMDIKTLERLFANLVTGGINCSFFESDIIVEKAKSGLNLDFLKLIC
jgi:hypothetical protein